MTQFLKTSEYEAIAGSLRFPTRAFVGGKFVDACSGRTMETINPATGETIAQVAACGKEDVDAAVTCARRAFESGVWSKMHPGGRKKLMLRLAELMEENLVELAVLESVDSGKPLSACLLSDVPETVECIRWHAEYADKTYGRTSPSGDGTLGMIVKEPAGVVGCVLPWNFPLLMLAWKVGAAMSEGNSVVVKPASVTALTALKVAELAAEAGVPEGVFNVVPGPGGEAGEAGLRPLADPARGELHDQHPYHDGDEQQGRAWQELGDIEDPHDDLKGRGERLGTEEDPGEAHQVERGEPRQDRPQRLGDG